MAKNIYQKMADITNELGFVAKNLNVSLGKSSYRAVGEVDVLEAVKPLEHKHGVYSYPVNTNIVQQDIITSTSQYGDKQSFYIRLERIYRFVNIEEPDEFIELKAYGDGIDSGDKATGKAMTYADKYALMKAYKISTGDDPDKEGSKEYTKHDEGAVKLRYQAYAGNLDGFDRWYAEQSGKGRNDMEMVQILTQGLIDKNKEGAK